MTDFDTLINRKHTSSIKWDKYVDANDGYRDIIPMWVADSDFQTCPSVISALQERVAHGVFGYTSQPTQELTDAIIFHLDKCYDWQIEKDWIMLLPSLVSGLNLACQVAGEPGDSVISAATIYPPFRTAPKNAGRELLTVPMSLVENRWLIDFEKLQELLESEPGKQSRMLLFCNPHNPGGTVYTRQELNRLHTICKQYDLFICSDEIHCDLILDENKRHIPIACLNQDAAQRTITLMAASKTFNIAGLSCGFAIVSNETLRNKLKRNTHGLLPEVNLLGQVASATAFSHGHGWIKQQNSYLRENRDYLVKEINALPGLKMVSPEATFLAWIDVSALKLDTPLQFFEDAGVGISAGKDFGDTNFVRLNFACSREILEEAVKRIRNAIFSLNMS